MDATIILAAARTALAEQAHRIADLVRSCPDSAIAIPGSDWTIRDAAVHLVVMGYGGTEIATGTPSPYSDIGKEALAAVNAALIADIPETDPGKLAALLSEATDRFLDATAGRPGDQEVTFHCGLPFELARMVCTGLGEHLLHGYDLATALGAPWPIDPAHAGLVLYGYSPLYALMVNPATTAGLTAAYGIELRTGAAFTVRFTDGVYSMEPPGGSVDCTLWADPVAFLLVGAGRLSPWTAIALGLLGAGGARPELALGFTDLFVYP